MPVMTLEQAVTLLVLMFVSQIPLLIAAVINWLKSREGAQKAAEAVTAANQAVTTAQNHAQSLETKLDDNTKLTAKIDQQTNGILDDKLERLNDHADRIEALETDVKLIRGTLEALSRNVDSTRHEIRGHLQGIMNQIGLLSRTAPVLPANKPEEESK